MFPIFVPGNSPSNRDPRMQAVLMGMVVLMVLGLGLMLFMRGTVLNPGWILIMLIAFGSIGLTMAVLVARAQRSQGASDDNDKAKRGLAGLDMYSVIDRLVEDLDEDEAAYLRRRMDEREQGLEQDVRQTVDELLEQRDRDRREGKR